MRKLLLLALLPLFFACSSDDKIEGDIDVPQDYTSFVVGTSLWGNEGIARNIVVGYKTEEGIYKRIATLGDIKASSFTQEVKVDIDKTPVVSVFCDAVGMNGDYSNTWVMIKDTKLEKNKKNKLEIPASGGSIVSKIIPTEYPIE